MVTNLYPKVGVFGMNLKINSDEILGDYPQLSKRGIKAVNYCG
jgi:hypothetical protein